MNFKVFTAGTDDEGRRLDKVVRKMARNSGISSIFSAIRKGLIRVNDRKAEVNKRISAGDRISIAEFLLESDRLNIEKTAVSDKIQHEQKQVIELDFIFQNEFIKIINKPFNINVHDKNGISEIIEEIYRNEKHENSLSFVPGPLHRLDRKTTGLLVFSNNLEGAKWFSNAIKEKNVRKFYIGIVENELKEKQVWENYIVPAKTHNSNFYTMKIDPYGTDETDYAKTICTPLSYGKYKGNSITLCQFEILTGKKHQIRCQASFNGFPLLGDTAYGAKPVNEKQDFFLHAYKLFFPKDNEIKVPEEITAPLNDSFKKFLIQSLINWDSSLII